MRQQASGSPTSPSGIAARYLQTRIHFPTSAQDGPLHGERPALRRACSQTYQRAPPLDPPLHRRKAPSHTSRGIPAARKQARAREKTPASSLPSFPPPSFSRPMSMHHLSGQPPANDGDRRPDLRKVFSGMGRAREGKGQFLQKTPLPLSSSPCSTAFPQQKSGAVACTRFYRKNKGTLIDYFLSPLCLRL